MVWKHSILHFDVLEIWVFVIESSRGNVREVTFFGSPGTCPGEKYSARL